MVWIGLKIVWFRFPTDPVNLCETQIILWALKKKRKKDYFFLMQTNYVLVQHLFILYKDERIFSFLHENNLPIIRCRWKK
jgi:hypothetical protein